ncbi:hypothetical protein HanIR_Chr17g0867381 [Helianthus annuus]|nr:hypothetical protein HanIR_Chr17g0867381 [Helianthus annuus]
MQRADEFHKDHQLISKHQTQIKQKNWKFNENVQINLYIIEYTNKDHQQISKQHTQILKEKTPSKFNEYIQINLHIIEYTNKDHQLISKIPNNKHKLKKKTHTFSKFIENTNHFAYH